MDRDEPWWRLHVERTSYPLAHLLVFASALGFRRWLTAPWQWTLGGYTLTTAVCALGLSLQRVPASTAFVVSALLVAVVGTLLLSRHGLRIVDLVVALMIIVLTAAMLFPAMENTRMRTMGRRTLPLRMPARYAELLYGPP
ncbi:hypothetical protein ACYOEI_08420 [Singulisphaera rosea]